MSIDTLDPHRLYALDALIRRLAFFSFGDLPPRQRATVTASVPVVDRRLGRLLRDMQ